MLTNPFLRLGIAMMLMLAFAAAEWGAAHMTGLGYLAVDAFNMVGHTLLMGLSMLGLWLCHVLQDTHRKIEGALGVCGSMLMIGFAVSIAFWGMGHNHGMDICGGAGFYMSAFAVAGFFVHAITTGLLHAGRANMMVYGSCIYMGYHTLMMALMFLSGLVMQSFGWWFLDQWLTFLLAAFIFIAAARLGYKSMLLWMYGAPAKNGC